MQFAVPSTVINKRQVFRKTWPYKDEHGCYVHDAGTNAPKLTGFSAVSRRCNNMFTMAMHEVQSTSAERELRLGNELRPSNIRIHGTMYRKVWTAEDKTPVRFLVVDPQERGKTARELGLDGRILQMLEQAILPRNEYTKQIRRLAPLAKRCPNAAIRLQWHEDINELAAIVENESTGDHTHRSVLYQLRSSKQPQYLHPLNPMHVARPPLL